MIRPTWPGWLHLHGIYTTGWRSPPPSWRVQWSLHPALLATWTWNGHETRFKNLIRVKVEWVDWISLVHCTCCCPHSGWAWGRRRRGLCRAQQTHPGWAAQPPGCHLYCQPSAAPLQLQPAFVEHRQLVCSLFRASSHTTLRTQTWAFSHQWTDVFYSQYVMWMSVMFLWQLHIDTSGSTEKTSNHKNNWLSAVRLSVGDFKLSPSPSSSSVWPLWAGSAFSADLLQPCRWLAESTLRTETTEIHIQNMCSWKSDAVSFDNTKPKSFTVPAD